MSTDQNQNKPAAQKPEPTPNQAPFNSVPPGGWSEPNLVMEDYKDRPITKKDHDE